MRVKSPSEAKTKWIRNTATAGEAYKSGIQNPRRPWAEAAAAANNNYVAGVTAAAAKGSFATGVQKAGNSTWQKGAIEKGSVRWAPGVQAAGGDYESGVGPSFAILNSLTLPDRGPAGSAQNEQRSLEVQRALHAGKVSRGGI